MQNRLRSFDRITVYDSRFMPQNLTTLRTKIGAHETDEHADICPTHVPTDLVGSACMTHVLMNHQSLAS
jgi:hypothetical protein